VTTAWRHQNDDRKPRERSPGQRCERSGGLSVTVVFTTVPETLAALRKAAILAHELGARIQIFVPYVVPYPLPLDRPQADPNFRVRQFRTMCEQEPIETRIEIQLCRNAGECLVRELAPESVVLIGDKRAWPFSGSMRLARWLQHRGHHVLVVRQSPRPVAKPAACSSKGHTSTP
jgi:hypothetical protein